MQASCAVAFLGPVRGACVAGAKSKSASRTHGSTRSTPHHRRLASLPISRPSRRTLAFKLVAHASASIVASPPLKEEPKPWGLVVAASVAATLRQAADRISTAFKNACSGKELDSEDVNKQVKWVAKHVKIMWAVAPFAAVSSSSSANTFLLITRAVASFIKLYLLLLFLRVLLSWFPTFDWMQQPWLALRQVISCVFQASLVP